MRLLKEYKLKDWLRLIPVKWLLKEIRNDVLLTIFLGKDSRDQDAAKIALNKSKKKCLVAIIAFERPELIFLQIKNFDLYFQEAQLVVFDNSQTLEQSEKIRNACLNSSAVYLKLPENRTRHPNRSHGLALQWTFKKKSKIHLFLSLASLIMISYPYVKSMQINCF